MTNEETILAALLLAALPAAALAADDHIAVQPGSMKWGPPPPGLPAGAQVAVISGNPASDGPYVVRARLPAGYKIAPHTHPTDENVTVLAGTFHIAMGDKFDAKKGEAVKAGGFFTAAEGHAALWLDQRPDDHPDPRGRPVQHQLRESGRRSAQQNLGETLNRVSSPPTMPGLCRASRLIGCRNSQGATMAGKTIQIHGRAGSDFDCYLAVPPTERPVPAVVLASAIHGVDKDLRDLADEFAAHRFIAAAPDLFWRTIPGPLTRADGERTDASARCRGLKK